MKIFYSHKAEKQFKDLPKSVQKRIAEKMIIEFKLSIFLNLETGWHVNFSGTA